MLHHLFVKQNIIQTFFFEGSPVTSKIHMKTNGCVCTITQLQKISPRALVHIRSLLIFYPIVSDTKSSSLERFRRPMLNDRCFFDIISHFDYRNGPLRRFISFMWLKVRRIEYQTSIKRILSAPKKKKPNVQCLCVVTSRLPTKEARETINKVDTAKSVFSWILDTKQLNW